VAYDYRQFLREFEAFRIRARHLFEDRAPVSPPGAAAWTPSVDVYEEDGRLVLVAELAGVRLEDVRIEVAGSALILRGDRPFERTGLPPESCVRMEFGYGPFERTFTLPWPVDSEGVEARLRDGVLTVTMPPSPAGRGRRIAIAAE
jgi:HSP20 family protein